VRIGKYRFKPEVSDLTRAYFEQAAGYEEAGIGAAMRAFAANPADPKRRSRLSPPTRRWSARSARPASRP
jgi:carboxypeptidase PM20D1